MACETETSDYIDWLNQFGENLNQYTSDLHDYMLAAVAASKAWDNYMGLFSPFGNEPPIGMLPSINSAKKDYDLAEAEVESQRLELDNALQTLTTSELTLSEVSNAYHNCISNNYP